MTTDPIAGWLGTPDAHNAPVEEPQPKVIHDDPSQDPIGTVRVFPRWQDEDHPRELAIRWRDPADTTEQHPWLILGSDGPQQLSNDSVRGCTRVGVVPTRGDGVLPSMPRLQVLRLPGDRYALVFDNVADPSAFDGVDMNRIRDHLGAAAVLVLEFPIEVL